MLSKLGTTAEISSKLAGGKIVCVLVRVCWCGALASLYVVIIIIILTCTFVTLCLIWEGQFDPEGLLTDQSTLALRVLLCPRWGFEQLYHFPLKPGITLQWWMRGSRSVYRNRGDKTLCHSSTQLDSGTRMSKLGRPGGKKALINGSCFGPNTQLADLTKSSVSPLPLFFSAFVKCLSSA